jgi:glycosyltransferase involved in cell wall biosynthesis
MMSSTSASLAGAVSPPPSRIPQRVGFVSTRFHGTDGVSLEAGKWARIFEGFGSRCFWMAGLLDTPPEVSFLEELAYFRHPDVVDLQAGLFGRTTRHRQDTWRIDEMKAQLKEALYAFIERFDIELLIAQNILAIPMHIPLGLAFTEVVAETGLPVIAHHHDFSWERERFTMNGVGDYLAAAFPPTLPRIEHVVINSLAQRELARRFGLSSTLIPNVIDFETPPPAPDAYSADFREEIGLTPDDILFLQPTRIVARKGIEHAIELLRQLRDPRAVLVLSHPAGDEGNEYGQLLEERIAESGIRSLFVADRIGEARGRTSDGRKIYTLFDIYPHADFVTYPSLYEGFGNAFLEAVYFGRPVLVNEYAVYARDIGPLGFRTVSMSQLVTREVVRETREVLDQPALRESWARHNYELGVRFFSHAVLRRKLLARLAALFGEGG